MEGLKPNSRVEAEGKEKTQWNYLQISGTTFALSGQIGENWDQWQYRSIVLTLTPCKEELTKSQSRPQELMNSLAEMSLSRNVGGGVDTNMGQGVRWTIIWSPSSMRVYALPLNCKSSISIVGRTTLGSDHYHFIETCPYSGAPTNTQTVSIWKADLTSSYHLLPKYRVPGSPHVLDALSVGLMTS